MDRMAVQVARLTRVVHAAGFGQSCLTRGFLEEKGAEGNLTVVGGGRHRNGERPATRFNFGGYLLPTTRGSGGGETKAGMALDAVENGCDVGASYRSESDGRRAVKE
jgi:hypothetical protein